MGWPALIMCLRPFWRMGLRIRADFWNYLLLGGSATSRDVFKRFLSFEFIRQAAVKFPWTSTLPQPVPCQHVPLQFRHTVFQVTPAFLAIVGGHIGNDGIPQVG